MKIKYLYNARQDTINPIAVTKERDGFHAINMSLTFAATYGGKALTDAQDAPIPHHLAYNHDGTPVPEYVLFDNMDDALAWQKAINCDDKDDAATVKWLYYVLYRNIVPVMVKTDIPDMFTVNAVIEDIHIDAGEMGFDVKPIRDVNENPVHISPNSGAFLLFDEYQHAVDHYRRDTILATLSGKNVKDKINDLSLKQLEAVLDIITGTAAQAVAEATGTSERQ